MNEGLWEMLGRDRYEESLREAEAARAGAHVGRAVPWRERVGLALVRLGTAVAGHPIESTHANHAAR